MRNTVKISGIILAKRRTAALLCITGLICFLVTGCSKLVEIPEPINTITTSETFSTPANAEAAIIAIYQNMMVRNALTAEPGIYPSMSADELHAFNAISPFETNTLTSTMGLSDNFWNSAYYNIYQANAAIEGIEGSKLLTSSLKSRLIAEAKFLRAYCHFYLVNYYGDIPLVLTSSYKTNSLISRIAATDVYQQIVADLKDARDGLPSDFSISNGERVRANSPAATALLARVYLYMQKWDSAEAASTEIISKSGAYSLVTSLDSIFLKNNTEAVWQLQQGYNGAINTAATLEGYIFIPYDENSSPNFYLSTVLMNAFEPGDLRRSHWVDSVKLDDGTGIITTYYYPFKYKVRTTSVDNVTEYTTCLRLAEQYLIRAEARAEQNTNLEGAIADLNMIRNRAALPSLPNTLGQDEVLAAIARERRIEFFTEYAHRWFDLKRTGQANAVLGPLKPTWKPSAVLYPVPYPEIEKDPNLTQNPGY